MILNLFQFSHYYPTPQLDLTQHVHPECYIHISANARTKESLHVRIIFYLHRSILTENWSNWLIPFRYIALDAV